MSNLRLLIVITVLALSMLTTGSLVKAAILGSMAAACECELDGNIPIQLENVLAKIHAVEKLTNYSSNGG